MAAERGTRERLVYLDNLKWVLIAGVIVSHAAAAYGALGAWLYVEPTLGSTTKAVFSVVSEVGDLFALGTFMLVAGLLTAPSLSRKGATRFVGDRLLRLGVPFLLTLVLVTPLVVWMIVAVTGYPLTLAGFVQWHLRSLVSGPMWFVAVLLLFTIVYAGWRRVRPKGESEAEPLRIRHLVLAAALIAALSFAVRLAFPIGSAQPLDAHLWQWPQLGVLFAFGVLAAERGWLLARPAAVIRWTCWMMPPAVLAVLFGTIAASGTDLSAPSGMALYSGGWHWQSALTSAVEGLVAITASLAMIDLFRRFGTWHGRLAHALGRDSYAAFFLQMPVLIALELGVRGFAWPGEVKLALTAPAGIAICFAIPWAVRRGFAAARPTGHGLPARSAA